MTINVGGRLSETVKGSVTEIYEDTKTENVKKAVVEVYEDTKNESVTKKVTETFSEGQQTSITGEYDLDATGAISIESDPQLRLTNQVRHRTQLVKVMKRKELTQLVFLLVTVTTTVTTGSATVFIGDTGSTDLAEPTPAPEIDPNPVSVT